MIMGQQVKAPYFISMICMDKMTMETLLVIFLEVFTYQRLMIQYFLIYDVLHFRRTAIIGRDLLHYFVEYVHIQYS